MGSEEFSPFFVVFLHFLAFPRFFSFFFAFFSLFFAFFAFLRFFRFSSLFSSSPRTRANNCNLLENWGISLRPRLHQPRFRTSRTFSNLRFVVFLVWRIPLGKCDFLHCASLSYRSFLYHDLRIARFDELWAGGVACTDPLWMF